MACPECIVKTADGHLVWVTPYSFEMALASLLLGMVIGMILLMVRPLLERVGRQISRQTVFWLTAFTIVIMPLIIEDLTGLVYQDQNVLLDHLGAVGVLVGVKALMGLRKRFYIQHPELAG